MKRNQQPKRRIRQNVWGKKRKGANGKEERVKLMRDSEIIERCTRTLRMSNADAKWVAEHLYEYVLPDFSEWSWQQIDECFNDVLSFKVGA